MNNIHLGIILSFSLFILAYWIFNLYLYSNIKTLLFVKESTIHLTHIYLALAVVFTVLLYVIFAIILKVG